MIITAVAEGSLPLPKAHCLPDAAAGVFASIRSRAVEPHLGQYGSRPSRSNLNVSMATTVPQPLHREASQSFFRPQLGHRPGRSTISSLP